MVTPPLLCSLNQHKLGAAQKFCVCLFLISTPADSSVVLDVTTLCEKVANLNKDVLLCVVVCYSFGFLCYFNFFFFCSWLPCKCLYLTVCAACPPLFYSKDSLLICFGCHPAILLLPPFLITLPAVTFCFGRALPTRIANNYVCMDFCVVL